MRIHINLATEKFEDAREFFVRWSVILGLAGLITVALLVMAAVTWSSERQDRRQIADLRNRISELEKQRSAAESILNKPENRDTRDRSRFLNAQFARKAFSWTRVLSALEHTMPPRVHVENIQPTVSDDNRLLLNLTVSGSSHESAVELVRRLEKSPDFRNAQLLTENPGQDNTVTFNISALYTPGAGAPAAAANEEDKSNDEEDAGDGEAR